jgi:phosphatidylglycerol:prolipoprotein diacylglycerol transferase
MADAPLHPSGCWVNTLDPFLWRIHGEFGIRWYGLAYLAGILIGGWLIARWARRGQAPFRAGEVSDFAFVVGTAMVLGGRLGYCLFYQPRLFLEFGGGPPWWGLLKVMDGGMSSHGGIIGLLAGCWWWARSHRRSLPVLADQVCAVAPIGVICGRIANFINGELWGRIADPPVPWAVVFPTENADGIPRGLDHDQARAWLLDPQRVALLPARHPSQLYAMVLEGLLPLLIVLPLHLRHRRPALTSGVLVACYAVGRIIDECWRQPDAGQPGDDGVPRILGLFSKGQALSLPLLAMGIAVAIWAARRPSRHDLYVV